MLWPLLGSSSSERVLGFILARDKGYATEIARSFRTKLYSIQKQPDKLERRFYHAQGYTLSRDAVRSDDLPRYHRMAQAPPSECEAGPPPRSRNGRGAPACGQEVRRMGDQSRSEKGAGCPCVDQTRRQLVG